MSGRERDTPYLLPRFYIKGSYVLDVVFGRSAAQDIDFFYDNSRQSLTAAEARSWLEKHNLPQHAPIDGPIPVDTVDDCSGGGFPEFNIDRWHIREDGNLYTLEDTEESEEYGGLFGRSLYKTKVMRLHLASAQSTSLTVLFPPYYPSEADGINRVQKAIRKMSDHPELFNDALKRKLEATLISLKNGEPPASSDTYNDDDLEICL